MSPASSVLSAPARTGVAGADPAHRRPLLLVASLGGVAAAGAVLLVCLGVAVIGWFFSDTAAHGEPRDALRVGTLVWLTGHGSGVRVAGTVLGAVPLLVTLGAAWSAWRIGHRVGSAVSGHGPDADQIADGERDWTVPVSAACFAAGYAAVTLVTASLAGTAQTALDTAAALTWAVLIALVAGGSAIAVGSGRAAIWTAVLPGNLRATAAACRAILRSVLLAATVALVTALCLDLATAVNLVSGLGLTPGESVLYATLSLLLLPNAVLFSASYLLGPGFAVGAQTLVSPTVVVTGALPAFPMLAALPDSGPVPGWTPWLIAVPPLAAALGAALAQRRRPTLRWEEGALRGCAGGVAAGVLLGWLAGLAGGAVGPGRMQVVGPLTGDVLVHAITALGIGGLVGGLAMTWWQRRASSRAGGSTG